MCGISGIYTPEGQAADPEFSRAVGQMTSLQAHRGPDAEGFWSDPDGILQLGFRRLSILDLTPAGDQPMIAQDGRSVIVFNGEIYNFQELRSELESLGTRFRSRSDSEVLLESLSMWGPDAIPRLNGMFAFAWYDLESRRLVLARDHAGIKPLYYFVPPGGKGLAFASQFDALLHTPWGEPGGIRLDVLHLYLQLSHIPAPYGILDHTFQVEPGHYLLAEPDGHIQNVAWWRLERRPEPDLHGEEALDALSDAINAAIERQRIADVPLGVFLSGGIDSPLVCSALRRRTGPDLKAFTIGAPGWWQDESADAARYATHLDLDHRVLKVQRTEVIDLIPEVIAAQHELFADFSILPTLLVSRFARGEVTVALSGDGGDELMFGYERPRSLLRDGSLFRWPRPVRLALYAAGKYGLGPKRSSVIVFPTPGHYYLGVNSRMKDGVLPRIAPDLPALPGDFDLYSFDRYDGDADLAHYSRHVEYYGQLQRGLKKVDMASMHNSLEVRVPLLDREVLDTSLRIDPFDSLKNGGRKRVLRNLLARSVPPEIIPQPKRGFSVPLADWLRGPLAAVVEETLIHADTYPAGLFRRNALQNYWDEHRTGKQDHKWGLWALLSLQWWYGAKARSSG